MKPFDPYHMWLAIPPNLHPPNHYQLLGLELFESDVNVISNAADQRMAHVKSFSNGPHGAESQRLLNELSQARIQLMTPELRRAYDASLRTASAQSAASPAPSANIARPVAMAAQPVAQPYPVAQVYPVAQAYPVAQQPTIEPAHTSANAPAGNGPDPQWMPPTTTETRRRKSSNAPIIIGSIAITTIIFAAITFTLVSPTTKNPGPVVANPTTPANSPQNARPSITPSNPATRDPLPGTDHLAETDAVSQTRSPGTAKETARSENLNGTSQPGPDPANPIGVVLPVDRPIDPVEPITTPRSPDKVATNPATGTNTTETNTTEPNPKEVETSPPITDGSRTPLPDDFGASLGTAFLALAENDLAGCARQRQSLEKTARASNDPEAIASVAELTLMEQSFTKTWEVVNIAVDTLSATVELRTQSGAIASVVEANRQRLILRANGQQRRYESTAIGEVNVFPTMSPDLVLLLTDQVTEKSAQATRAIEFLRGLHRASLLGRGAGAKDPAILWKEASAIWNRGGNVPPDFFGNSLPGTTAGPDTRPNLETQPGGNPITPNTGPGFHTAQFQFDDNHASRLVIPLPSDMSADNARIKISRIYLGPTLGVRNPGARAGEIGSGETWTIAGDFLRFQLQAQVRGDEMTLVTNLFYRRSARPGFRFEPLLLEKIAAQEAAITTKLKRDNISLESLIPENANQPLAMISIPASATIDSVIKEVGRVNDSKSPQIELILRMRQIQSLARELKENGWIEMQLLQK